MICIIGTNSQTGRELGGLYKDSNALFVDRTTIDITKPKDIINFFSKNHNVTCIINCAAFTAVDQAETDEEACYKVNVEGVKNLCDISAENNIPLIHISTDYVFDGAKNTPYTTSDNTNPQSVYGKTKLEGEHIFMNSDAKGLIIRTSWLYSEFSKNFVKTMLSLGKTKKEINVVFDQIGTPTYAKDLALAIKKIIPQLKDQKEILHFSNEGVASWYDFAYKIFDYMNIDCNITPVTSDKFKTTAKRPHYSVLDKSKIKDMFNINIRNWNKALEECLDNIKHRENNA
jgi:dTDP-4-dehydrorhamnose reductase